MYGFAPIHIPFKYMCLIKKNRKKQVIEPTLCLFHMTQEHVW